MSNKKLLTSFQPLELDVKNIKESRDLNGGKLVLRGVMQRADAVNQNGRIYPRHVLQREMENYQKFINERRALGELDHPTACVPPGTTIFTRHGWKNIEDITENEEIATLHLETNVVQWQTITRKIISDHTISKMIRIRNEKSYDFTVTANHRVLLWNRFGKPFYAFASDIHEGNVKDLNHCSISYRGQWTGEDPGTVTVGDFQIDAMTWAGFLGIYLAEGSCDGTKRGYSTSNKVMISQNVGEKADAIRTLLADTPWSWKEYINSNNNISFEVNDAALHTHLYSLGNSHQKHVPSYAKNWSPTLLNEMLTWMMLGDGVNRKPWTERAKTRGSVIRGVYTISEQLAKDIEEIFYRIGSGCSITVQEPKTVNAPDYSSTGRIILAENKSPIFKIEERVSKRNSLDKRFLKTDAFDYEGKVYCVEVPNGNWLMKQGDKVCWTGNSIINLQNVSHLVTEARWDGDAVVGSIELLDTPMGKIAQSLVESGVKLGISSRGVGTTSQQGDYDLVEDDFMLLCYDLVSEPSTSGAFMLKEHKVNDALGQLSKSDRVNRVLTDILGSLKK
jgi:hypothetical protein